MLLGQACTWHIGTIAGYNNEIVIPPVGQPLGVNIDVNSSPTPVLVETVVPQSPDDSEATAIPSESTPPAAVWHTTQHDNEKNSPHSGQCHRGPNHALGD